MLSLSAALDGLRQLEEASSSRCSSCEQAVGQEDRAFFGSYGWGDGGSGCVTGGRCVGDGALMAYEPVICNDAPEGDTVVGLNALRQLSRNRSVKIVRTEKAKTDYYN